MNEKRDGRFSGRHNQNQGPPGDHIPSHASHASHAGGLTARERRYMRERRRARTHRSLLADSGAGEMRIAVLRPLLAETVTLEVEQSWRVLFPDAPEVDEVDEVDVEAVEDPDVAQDVGDTDNTGDAAW